MKRLVVFSDGTWQTPDQRDGGEPAPTNVVKLWRAVKATDDAGVAQLAFYHDGVGARGSLRERWTGGAFGLGISQIIRQCYRFLIHSFEPGDQIFLLGFSRGAYLARSTAGLIRNAGLLKREHETRIDEAYELYRRRDEASHPTAPEAQAFRDAYAHETRIRFIGVWDTVGALGIPVTPLRFWTKPYYSFHDVKLSRWVDFAHQALAVDERRKPFSPTLWQAQPHAGAQVLEQAWFPGVHGDVGGGYREHALSDLALAWLADKARAAGLALSLPPIEPDPAGPIHDSMTFLFRLLGAIRRAIAPGVDGQVVNGAVRDRVRSLPDYRPPNVPAA